MWVSTYCHEHHSGVSCINMLYYIYTHISCYGDIVVVLLLVFSVYNINRVFGHFEKPLFVEMCKNVETKFLPAGTILFRPGQV